MPMIDEMKVRFWIGNRCDNGSIIINQEGMFIKQDKGQIFSGIKDQDIIYEMSTQILPEIDGKQIRTVLETPVKISLKPLTQNNLKYNPRGGQYIEDTFPHSTKGFYGRMMSGTENYLFIVQRVIDNSGYWLTIADSKSGQLHEAHHITHYEAEALSLTDDHEFRQTWYEEIWSKTPVSETEEIFNILDDSKVTWTELSRLLGDISVPNLRLGETTRETLSQLVPSSFPIEVQRQIVLFLAFILKIGIPNKDPIDYLYKFWSLPIFGALLEGHLMCLIDGVPWPSYVKTLTLASRKHLEAPTKAIEKSVSESPWLLFWTKIMEQFPNWFDIASNFVKELNDRKEVISKIPVHKATMRKSIESWKKRLAILMYEIRLVGRINPQVIGLTELVYLGSAYRWPHRHMKYITRLGSSAENPPYLQVMLMPPSAAAQVSRLLPNIMKVESTTRTLNFDLFDSKEKEWHIPTQEIISSVGRRSSFKKFMHEFKVRNQFQNAKITKEEAKVADLAADGIRLVSMERKEYLDPWGLKIKRVQSLLSSLATRHILEFTYEAVNDKLISLATIVEGSSERILSVCSAFLTNTPTTLFMLGNSSSQAIMLSRVPETTAYELASELPGLGLNQDLIIRCLRPTTFQSYNHNLFQRLLRDDGTWDDDVSAFLSQARSKRKELSEDDVFE